MRYDVAIVGAGIIGQAHAYAFLKRGLSVALLDSRASLVGQCLGSLGLIRPAAQPPALYPLALKSRRIWLEVIESAGLWHRPCGSLRLAQSQEELSVIEEFTVRSAGFDVSTSIIDPDRASEICKPLQSDNLYGAMWSPADIVIDPADADQVISRLNLPNLDLRLGLEIMSVNHGEIVTAEEVITSDLVLDCRAPVEHLGSTLVTFGFCRKLDWNLNTAVTTGAALNTDPAFRICRSHSRPADHETELPPTICALPDNLVLIGHSESAMQELSSLLQLSEVQSIGTKTCPRVNVYDQPYIRTEIDGVWRIFADSGSELTLAFGAADETADLLL